MTGGGQIERHADSRYDLQADAELKKETLMASLRTLGAIFTALILSAMVAGIAGPNPSQYHRNNLWWLHNQDRFRRYCLAADVFSSSATHDRTRLSAVLWWYGAAEKCPGDNHAELHHHGADLSTMGALGL